MIFRKIFATVTAVALTVGAASAATIDARYNATSAVGSGADHSVWFSRNIGASGKDFDFDPAGLFTLYSDGVATLTGRVVSQNKPNAWFDLSFNYDNDFSATQIPTFKSENGSVATPDSFYRDLKGGTLTGGGILAGLNLSVTRAPADGKYAAQIGEGTDTNNGANNKNNNFGMANWFKIAVVDSDCRLLLCEAKAGGNGQTRSFNRLNGRQGDVNIDLAPVPVPAAGLLMIGALGALGILRRRRRKAA